MASVSCRSARPTSAALASTMASSRCSRRSAAYSRASLRVADEARATSRLAALARCPSSTIGVGGLDCTVSAYLPGPGDRWWRPRPSVQDDEVVTVDHLGCHVLGQLVGPAAGPLGHHHGRLSHQAFGEDPARRGRRSRPRRRPRSRHGRTPPRPAGANGPARPGPDGPRHPPRWSPTPRWRRRSTACGPAAGARGDGSGSPRRGPSPSTAASTPGRAASAITASTPDHTAILAAASFEPMPPLPTAEPGPPAIRSSSWSISTTSSMREPASVRRGSSVSSPAVSVRRTRTSALTRWATSAASRSLSPNRISSSATASFSLTTGTTPSSSRRDEGLAGVEVLAPVHEVERSQQHLAGHEAVTLEGVAPHLHQPVLADGRHRLEGGRVRRDAARRGPAQLQPAAMAPEVTTTTRPARGPDLGHLAGQLVDGVRVHPPRPGGDRRGADLDHHGPGRVGPSEPETAPLTTGGAGRPNPR